MEQEQVGRFGSADRASAGHVLSIKTSPGFGPGQEYRKATCACGWEAGAKSEAVLRSAHAEHMEEARDAAAVMAARERIRDAAPELLEALTALVERYTALVNSGDCGFRDPEEEGEVEAARAAIARATGAS